MKKIWILWSIYTFCVGQAIAVITSHMDQLCDGAIPNHERYRQISFKFDPTNVTQRDCLVRVYPGALKRTSWSYSVKGFLLVFEEVNFFNSNCRDTNFSVTERMYFPDYEYEYGYPPHMPDPKIPGIPVPLCQGTIPWSKYPSPMIQVESDSLDIRFQGGPSTPEGVGFKLLIVDFYRNSLRCQPGEYRCNNDRCLPNGIHDCDGTDWCGDGSGCRVSVGLIVGLCAGIGSALLGLGIGFCIACYAKRKSSHSLSVPTSLYWRDNTTISANRRNTTVLPRASRHPTAPTARQEMNPPRPSVPIREPGSSLEPPSYASLKNHTSNTAHENLGAASLPLTNIPTPTVENGSTSGDRESGQYQPPPPDYEMAVNFRDIYKVTESEPTKV